jgi:hypothetical protein
VGFSGGQVGAAIAQPPPGGGYGPCCPLGKEQSAPKPAVAGDHTVLVGPRYVCDARPISLAYEGTAHSVAMMEVKGALLAPARMFTMTGATLNWNGRRDFIMARGTRRVTLALGSCAVTIANGSDSKMICWALCPQLLNGIGYAPLRPLAEALGLTVGFKSGVVTLTEMTAAGSGNTPTHPATAPGDCPADRVDAALGVRVVRSPADSALGVGAGMIEVHEGGLAAEFGVQPKDVIIIANGERVRCPKDLDQLLAQLQAANGTLQTLVVARGQEKVALPAQPTAK